MELCAYGEALEGVSVHSVVKRRTKVLVVMLTRDRRLSCRSFSGRDLHGRCRQLMLFPIVIVAMSCVMAARETDCSVSRSTSTRRAERFRSS